MQSAVHVFTVLYLYCMQIPRWAYAVNALSLFVYQTLDALDGKQARRTGSASPLGEIFDHGCDAFSTGALPTPLPFSPITHCRYIFSRCPFGFLLLCDS